MFGEVLKKNRTEQKMSLDRLSKELNNKYDTKISKSMISRWENGTTDPQMEYVRIIADFFSLPLSSLIEGDQKNETFEKYNSLPKELQKAVDVFVNEVHFNYLHEIKLDSNDYNSSESKEYLTIFSTLPEEARELALDNLKSLQKVFVKGQSDSEMNAG